MDAGRELARAKWLILSGIVFLGSGCISWGEFIYLVAGQTAPATVTQVAAPTVRFSRGGGRSLEVTYSFTEADGTPRTGSDTVGRDVPVPASRTTVQYTPGKGGMSRLAGRTNWVALCVFGGSLLAVGVFGFLVVRRASAEVNDKPKKRK